MNVALKRKIPTSGTMRCTRQRSRPSRPVTTQSPFQLRVADRSSPRPRCETPHSETVVSIGGRNRGRNEYL